jgi:hypothetical protein
MKVAALAVAAALAIGLADAGHADEIVAAEQMGGTTVGFVLKNSYSNATLSVSGPNGFHASTSSKGGAVAIDLTQIGSLADGTYNYQLTAASSELVRVTNSLDNGRSGERRAFANKPGAKSGTFNVKGGRIVDYGVSTRRGRRDRD